MGPNAAGTLENQARNVIHTGIAGQCKLELPATRSLEAEACPRSIDPDTPTKSRLMPGAVRGL